MPKRTREQITASDRLLLERLRRRWARDGMFRTAGEWADELAVSPGTVRGMLERMTNAGNTDQKFGVRYRQTDGGQVPFRVRVFGPSHMTLRTTIAALEATARLAGVGETIRPAAEVQLTQTVDHVAGREDLVDATVLSLAGPVQRWIQLKPGRYALIPVEGLPDLGDRPPVSGHPGSTFRLMYEGPGFEVADKRPGHRVEIDDFLDQGTDPDLDSSCGP